MKRTGMTDIKDILRHRHDLGLPRAQIAAAVGVSAGTVSHVLDRALAAGLSWPLPGDLDDEALREKLYPTPERDSGHVQPDWDAVIEALRAPRKRRRARLTRLQLWKEYRDEALAQGGSAYSYSRFCARLKARLKDSGNAGPAQMRFDYAPGLYGLSDFSGKVLALRTGRGEKDVEIFVAVLAHSRLIYAEAVPDQRVRHWTMAHRRALEYFGGVPERWIIDNLKAGVHKPDREAPQLNASFREFAQHYNVAVLPARPGQATDKGLVEASVGAVQTRILLELRHQTFFSLDAMNAAIRRELDRLNDAPMASGERPSAPCSKRTRAGVTAAPAPEPLGLGRVGPPQGRAERPCPDRAQSLLGARRQHRPRRRGARRRAHGGSVPRRRRHAHRRPSPQEREQSIRHPGRAHARPPQGGARHPQTRLRRHPARPARARVGPSALAWAERCFASRDFPEQAFATVQGMIRLAEDHGEARLDALCAEALDLDRLASGFLRERIRNGGGADHPRAQTQETIPGHANIRGGAYYSNDKGTTP